jgi:peptidoglycan/xylan/chitin deacetylase (PgdA/CDA1 family)
MTAPASDPDRFEAGRESVEHYRQTPARLGALELAAFQDAGPYAVALRRGLLRLGAPALPRLLGRLAGHGPPGLRWRRFLRDYEFWRGVRAAVPTDDTWQALIRAPVMLMYHAIGRPGEQASRFVVPLRRFERQMAWLDSRGYRIMALSELLECRRRHVLPPGRSVVITFDDGYADNHGLALPVLSARRFRATFFLVSGAVGGTNAWDAGGPLAGRALMSWEQAGELLRHGMAVGSHTRSHPVVPDLSPADREGELRGARLDLEQALGRPIMTFAYPFGRMDDATATAVEQAGYEAACCSRSGANDPAVSQFALRRLEVRGTDSMVRFAISVGAARRLPRARTT